MTDRDWSTLRNREWRPTTPQAEENGTAGAGGSSSSGAGGGREQGREGSSEGAPGAAAYSPEEKASGGANGSNGKQKEAYRPPRALGTSVFLTDGAIASRKSGKGKPGGEKVLQQWEDPDAALVGSSWSGIEQEIGGKHSKKPTKGWDQFAANRELFGYVSTFKEDLTQYTTPLNVKTIPQEVKNKAKMIAQDIESRGRYNAYNDMGAEYEEEDQGDEENLFSAVPRAQGYHGNSYEETDCINAGPDGGMGGALLASLRAGSAATQADTSNGSNGSDHRSMIGAKVQAWWRKRRLTGVNVPPGSEDALVCPFSERAFGEVGMLLTHWAAALPRAASPDAETTTPCHVATEEFRRAAARLSFSKAIANTGLDKVMPTSSPRPMTVWAQIIQKLEVRGKASERTGGEIVLIADRMMEQIVSEAVQMRCWQRNQKVEHREVLEGIAAALALHILEDSDGSNWSVQISA